ncbi:MAG: SMI1/KNR4 family protein [Verrucomicrobiota bacterium]
MNIQQLWADLEAWISIRCKELGGVLRPGASPNKIEAVERMLGINFPDEVKQFYLCHDGQTSESLSFFDDFQFLPLDQVTAEWKVWQEIKATDFKLDEIPKAEIKPVYWNSRWVPFAADGCGNCLCIDLDPNQSGKSGQIICMWLDPSRVLLASSLTEWFSNFISRVKNNDIH